MMLDAGSYWWAYLLLGLVAGTFGAALGVGGGVIMVPALVMFFGANQKPAQATSMGAMIAIAIVGFYRYWAEPDIRKHIEILPVLLMGLAAVAGAYLGVMIAAALPKATLQKLFALVMVIAAARLFWKSMQADPPRPAPAAAAAASETGSPSGPSESPANRAPEEDRQE